MKCLGTGDNGEFTFMDIISIVSFCVGLQNLDMNISQEDMQRTAEHLDRILRENILDIHEHLSVQDAKLNLIMSRLEKL